MAKQKLKMWVWEYVLVDYTPGLVVCLAETAQDAVELFLRDHGPSGDFVKVKGTKIDGVEPVCYEVPACVWVSGGA